MPTRRQIREAAVQLLYARQASLTDPMDEQEFWELIQDRDAKAYDKARAKILVHLQQGRATAVDKLHEALVDATAAIRAADPSEAFLKRFNQMHEAEQKWINLLSTLLPLARADTGNWRQQLRELLLGTKKLTQTRGGMLSEVEAFPPLQKGAILKQFKKLNSFDDRVQMVAFPEKHQEQRELSHLIEASTEMGRLQTAAIDLAGMVTEHLPSIDARIEESAANYQLERLSKVDLAILRLGTFEAVISEKVPPKVAINEAIDLARDFSGEEAASFVNGVLDPLVKAKSQA